MTPEEFIKQYCTLCGSQRCYGTEYCGNYQRFVLGADSEVDKIMWAAKQQLVLRNLSEDAKTTTETIAHWDKVPTGRLIEDPDRVRWKCSSCGKETDLPNYDKVNYCFNCGTKMTGGHVDESGQNM